MVKNPPASAKDRRSFDPWFGKIPWRRAWQLTPVLLPGESHGQRSLAGYSPWGRKESDTTEWLTLLLLLRGLSMHIRVLDKLKFCLAIQLLCHHSRISGEVLMKTLMIVVLMVIKIMTKIS